MDSGVAVREINGVAELNRVILAENRGVVVDFWGGVVPAVSDAAPPPRTAGARPRRRVAGGGGARRGQRRPRRCLVGASHAHAAVPAPGAGGAPVDGRGHTLVGCRGAADPRLTRPERRRLRPGHAGSPARARAGVAANNALWPDRPTASHDQSLHRRHRRGGPVVTGPS